MPSWAWTVLGIAAGVFFWRLTFRTMLYAGTVGGSVDGDDVAWAAVNATLFFYVAGPVILIALIGRVILRATVGNDWGQLARILGGEPRWVKAARRDREFRDRERRIREAERELGLDGRAGPSPID